MKKEKKELFNSLTHGITLIALVITIIILIILAGVTINLTMGENGIFNRAIKAVEQTKIATAQEKIELAIIDYHASDEMVNLYSCLEKIEGIELIESVDNPGTHNNLPYKIVVDSYEFLIDTDLKVTYQGKANGEKPEITSFLADSDDEEVTITVVAQTKDKKGISKVNLLCNDAIVDTKNVSGKNIEEEFKVTNNGKYKAQVIGENGRNVVSEELTVSSIVTMNGSISAGTVSGNTVTLTVHGESARTKIQKVEIYENDTLLTSKTKTYSEDKQEIDENIEIDNLPFAEEMDYYVIITGENEEIYQTNIIEDIMNTTVIANETDLRKLATIVNNGISGSGATVNLIADIEGIENWEPIGYWDGTGEGIDGVFNVSKKHYFAATFDGNNHEIEILSLSTSSTYKTTGLFGSIIGGTVKNLKVSGEMVNAINGTAGIAGTIKDGRIENCINEVDISSTTTNVAIGGIMGFGDNTTIYQCGNEGTINCGATSYIGGIAGSMESGSILECYNKAAVIGEEGVRRNRWTYNWT